ncbi:hypothetical protein BDM02DRAFT_3117085 [Thelephora ganbajun]|uniref:Uncharacterized protein n=1 Tax=Thelephora ganbajun TaxID=370292 RepID=A0ACB6ZD00_THEGA|nr:hypothetical protein BDM02DRAFT_3117085 [Thelephora ganbajun]
MGTVDVADLGAGGWTNHITIILFIITFFITFYRCFARYSKRLWWYDDSVALFSAFSFIVFLVGSIYLAQGFSSPGVGAAGTYILAVGFYVPIWGGRISILLTVVRVTPWQLQRKILLWLVVFFALQFAMLTAQMFWVCELTNTGWKKVPGSICIVPQVVPISLVVSTVVSDSILIIAPLMISRGVHVRALRFRLFFIFSMSIATTLASLAHAVLVVVRPGVWEAIFGGVEAAVSVIVCSTPVIIPAILRVLNVGDPFMQEDTVGTRFNTGVEIARMTMTEIELSLPTSSGTGTTDSAKSEGAIPQQRGSVDLDARDDQKHRLPDVSLGKLKPTNIVLPTDEPDITDPPAQVRSLSAVKKDYDIEADVGERESNESSSGG